MNIEDDRPEIVTIVVHPLNKNKAPCGFAPWPKAKKKKRKNKRGKK